MNKCANEEEQTRIGSDIRQIEEESLRHAGESGEREYESGVRWKFKTQRWTLRGAEGGERRGPRE